MDFRILDASAFYAGVPFRSSEDCYTTSLVYDEIQHIKKNHDVLGTLPVSYTHLTLPTKA